jgi:FkbM family methyltransferase
MNYGNSAEFKESGELNTIQYIINKYSKFDKLTIFGVGANIGKYSAAIYPLFGDRSLLYSFEPSRKTFEKLIKNTSHINKINPFNIGFSDIEEDKILFSNEAESGLASVYEREISHHGIKMSLREKITLSTLDNFCKINNISTIHFLKLDVEGHEISVLNGANQMLQLGKIDFIQFEFGGCNIDSRTFFRDFYHLLNEKYKIYRILKNDLIEINQYSEMNEIFITTNYLAELRGKFAKS